MARLSPEHLPALLSGFLDEYLVRDKGLSPNTVSSYAQTFVLLFRFMANRHRKAPDRVTLKDLSADVILAFLHDLEVGRSNTARSRNVRLAAVKSFFRYVSFKLPAALEQASRVLSISGKRTDITVVDFLTIEEIRAVINAIDAGSPLGIRDRAMLLVTYECGLRVSEALSVTLADIDLGSNPEVRVLGKGRRRRSQPLRKDTAALLRQWVALRHPASGDRVFVNRHGQPLTRDGFAYRLAGYARKASAAVDTIGRKRVTPHVLRHSCAMHMLDVTGDIRKVALWLGHSDVQSTETYVRADAKAKESILTSSKGLGIKPGKFPKRALDVMTMLRAATAGKAGPSNIFDPDRRRSRPL